MPSNKSQHYLPQHYLRQFHTGNSKQIAVVRIKPFGFFPCATIKKQCKADYFYKTDGELDQIFTKLEKDLAPIITQVADNRQFSSEELTALQLFAVVTHSRTRRAVEEAKVYPKKVFTEVIQAAISRGDLPPPPNGEWNESMVDFGNVAGHLFMKTNVMTGWLETRTMGCKLLEAAPKSSFVTSDHPVILMNEMLTSTLPHRSFVGFSRSGFQMLLPISPSIYLFFYDPKVYKVGGRRHQLVKISTEDVELLNSLQVQSAEECMFLRDPSMGEQAEKLVSKYASLRSGIGNSLRELPGRNNKEKILHHVQFSPDLVKPWSFCRLQRRPRIGEDYRRDAAWSAYVQEVAKEMDANPHKDLFESMEAILGCPLEEN